MKDKNATITIESAGTVSVLRGMVTAKRVTVPCRQWDRNGKRISEYKHDLPPMRLLKYQIDGEPEVQLLDGELRVEAGEGR